MEPLTSSIFRSDSFLLLTHILGTSCFSVFQAMSFAIRYVGSAIKEGFAGFVDRSTQKFDAGEVAFAKSAARDEDSEAVTGLEDLSLGESEG